jgi:ribulose-5-phosphate 4-epimerase/fuculose-1-phosphate aldolase
VVIHHGPIGCRDQDTAEVAVRMAVLEALAKNLPAID